MARHKWQRIPRSQQLRRFLQSLWQVSKGEPRSEAHSFVFCWLPGAHTPPLWRLERRQCDRGSAISDSPESPEGGMR